MCKRDENYPNPVPNKISEQTLQFVSGRLLRCQSCRFWLRTCLVGRTAGEFQKEMDNDASGDKRAEYLNSLKSLEQVWNDSPGYVKNVQDKIPLPTWVNIVEETGTQDTVNLGVFWPKTVWEAEAESAEPFPEAKAVWYREQWGVWRDKKHGEPPGTITASKVVSKKAQRIHQISSSATAMKGDLDKAFDAAAGVVAGFSAKKVKLEDGSQKIEFQDSGLPIKPR